MACDNFLVQEKEFSNFVLFLCGLVRVPELLYKMSVKNCGKWINAIAEQFL